MVQAIAVSEADDDALDAAIEAYLSHTASRLVRVLDHALAGFEEPSPHVAPDRALRLVAPLVETLAGFALGRLAGALATGVRRWFGDDVARAVHAELGALAPRGRPEPLRTRYLADAAARPLVDELAQRLHPRVLRISGELRAAASATRAIVEQRAPGRQRTLATVFDLLRADELALERIAEELAAGWAQYRALLAGAPAPAGSPMWIAWARRARGHAAAAAPRYIAVIG
jgi:hypothetical protein